MKPFEDLPVWTMAEWMAQKAEIERIRAEMSTMHPSVVHGCCVDKQEFEVENTKLRSMIAGQKDTIDSLRAEMATMHRSIVHECCVDKQKTEAKIARVQELCAQAERVVIPSVDAEVYVYLVRRALEESE